MGDRGGGKNRPPTRTCFIGNLPWDIAEPQLKELFAEVGPIKNFRVVTDRETGKPKGFGFCEYFDTATAASAQRNLNGHEINGRRIHVDFAEDKERGPGGGGDGPRGPRAGPPRVQQPPLGMDSAQRASSAMASLVDGGPPPPVAPPDAVTSALAGMSKGQLYGIMAQMKGLIQQNLDQARQILVHNPQLTKALFQAQIMLGMVPGAPMPEPAPGHMNGGGTPHGHQAPPQYDAGYPQQQPPPAAPAPYQTLPYGGSSLQPAAYASAPMVTDYNPGGYGGEQPQGGQPGAYSQPGEYQPPAYSGPLAQDPFGPQQPPQQQEWNPPLQQQPPQYGNPQPQQQQPPPAQQAPGGDPRAAAGPVSDPRQSYLQQPQGAPYSPSHAQQTYTPLPQQQEAPPAAPPAQQLDSEQQKALLAQVMNLTPAQIDLLPPQQKAQVIALQQQMRHQGGGF